MSDEKRLRVGELEIAYEDRDAKAGASERPFVLVHGFTGSRDDWREVLPALSERGRTLAPDGRGHGGTTNPGDPAAYGFEPLVADLAGFLDALEVPRCDLLGHSLGGMVAMRFALAHPERVASLVLMDTSPYPVRAEVRAAVEAATKVARDLGMSALFEVLSEQGRDDPATRFVRAALGEEAYWERLRVKLEAMDPEAFAVLGLLLTDHESVEPRLGEIAAPTLVVVGAEDEPFLGAAQALERGIPGARRVVIADSAHSPQISNSRAWLEAVGDHLARVR